MERSNLREDLLDGEENGPDELLLNFDDGLFEDVEKVPKKKAPRSAKQKKALKNEERMAKKEALEKAAAGVLDGTFKSIQSAANFHNVPYTTLYDGLKNHGGTDFQGAKGGISKVMTPEEEQLIVDHVIRKASIGYGVTWTMVSYF